MTSLFLPDILYAGGSAQSGFGLLVDSEGYVAGVSSSEAAPEGTAVVRLPGRALLPGLANAHSHTFQRLFRGRAEGRLEGGDTFWTWREQMYMAAGFVSPEDIYDIARVTFLEMVRSGVTAVGEFHYIHRDPQGLAYSDGNLLGKQVIEAAQSVGLRICLLRTAYLRAGFEREPCLGQRRFYEQPDEYLRNLSDLQACFSGVENVSVGAAPHSIRAVSIELMRVIATLAQAQGNFPLHLHISEQVQENEACRLEYGMNPVTLVSENGILTNRTTLVHAIHLTSHEFELVAESGAFICSCPTTERNLGDGIFPADVAFRLGIPVAFGTDSQAQIDIFEDARQLEYHLRLQQQRRGILDASARTGWKTNASIGQNLFTSASRNGYSSLGLEGGSLAIGEPADFFTVDLDDLSILGGDQESLVSQAVFSLSKSSVRDVAVQGKLILQDGQHPEDGEIRARYREVQRRYLNHSLKGESL